MTGSHVWHDSCLCVTSTLLRCIFSDLFVYVTWLVHVCDLTRTCVTWLIHVWLDSCMCVTWLMHVCDLTHACVSQALYWGVLVVIYLCVWHDSFTCVTWPMHVCRRRFTDVCFGDLCVCVTWLVHMCDLTHSCVSQALYWCVLIVVSSCMGYDSFISASSHTSKCDMTHWYFWHGSSICVTWLVHTRDMTHSFVWMTQSCVSWSLYWVVCVCVCAYACVCVHVCVCVCAHKCMCVCACSVCVF